VHSSKPANVQISIKADWAHLSGCLQTDWVLLRGGWHLQLLAGCIVYWQVDHVHALSRQAVLHHALKLPHLHRFNHTLPHLPAIA
jgi:hypothetical protein